MTVTTDTFVDNSTLPNFTQSDTTPDSPDDDGYEHIEVPDDPKQRDPKEEVRQTQREDNSSAREQPSIPKGTTSTTSNRPTHYSLHPQIPTPRGYQQYIQRPPNSQSVSGYLSEERRETSEIRQSAQGSGYGQGVPSPPKDRYELLKEELRQMKSELKQVRENHAHELQRTGEDLRNANTHINQLLQEKQRWNDQMNGLPNESNNVGQQLEHARTLSAVCGKDPFGAQVKVDDTLSISEVGEKVTALNREIVRAAAIVNDAVIHTPRQISQGSFDAACADSQEMVGLRIKNLLISQSHKQQHKINPLLVQIVLQIFLVNFCVSKIQPWFPSGDPTVGAFLDAVYSQIRSTEEQAVSSRWRALTRAYSRPNTETWAKELSNKLHSVLKIAAWRINSRENKEFFERCVPSILKATSELRIAMGENFTSADLDVSVFGCDTTYEPLYMDNSAFGDDRQPSDKQTIVGTVGIGLRKAIAKHVAENTCQFPNVIPAKIVLESTLNEAVGRYVLSSGTLRKENTNGANQDGRD